MLEISGSGVLLGTFLIDSRQYICVSSGAGVGGRERGVVFFVHFLFVCELRSVPVIFKWLESFNPAGTARRARSSLLGSSRFNKF